MGDHFGTPGAVDTGSDTNVPYRQVNRLESLPVEVHRAGLNTVLLHVIIELLTYRTLVRLELFLSYLN